MYRYAQLNSDNEVEAISSLNNKVNDLNMIPINNNSVSLGDVYNHTTGKFVAQTPEAILTPPTETEQILYETQYQTMLLEMGGGM